MDPENIGKEKFGVVVLDGGAEAERWLRGGELNTYYYVSTSPLLIYRTSVTQLYKNNNPPK